MESCDQRKKGVKMESHVTRGVVPCAMVRMHGRHGSSVGILAPLGEVLYRHIQRLEGHE